MLRRLPGTPSCGPAMTKKLAGEIESSLKDCLWWKRGETDNASAQLPHRHEWLDNTVSELAAAREVHWWALVTTYTLDEKIEQISHSVTRNRQDIHSHLKSRDRMRMRTRAWSRR